MSGWYDGGSEEEANMMKETGILFTPDNIRAIREGRKVQTRRVIKPQPMTGPIWGDVEESEDYPYEWFQWFNGGEKSPTFTCPHGIPGDKLYIKEGVIIDKAFDPPELAGYYMDGARSTLPGQKRLTAMFMAKHYARTWLELTDVRVQRLQDISEEDAKAEGVKQRSISTWWNYFEDCYLSSAQQSFSSLWQSINGKNKPGEDWDAWDANPFVWALTFKLCAVGEVK
jgi:hypothetical protein